MRGYNARPQGQPPHLRSTDAVLVLSIILLIIIITIISIIIIFLIIVTIFLFGFATDVTAGRPTVRRFRYAVAPSAEALDELLSPLLLLGKPWSGAVRSRGERGGEFGRYGLVSESSEARGNREGI